MRDTLTNVDVGGFGWLCIPLRSAERRSVAHIPAAGTSRASLSNTMTIAVTSVAPVSLSGGGSYH